ncbi:MAG: hypothetical protein AAF333_06890 [Planctomycetota bacterium]
MTRFPFAALLVSLLALPVAAQQADFILFDQGFERVDLPPERIAVHPITSPFYHEDSFVTTDVRAWYLYHDFPVSSPIGGGSAKGYAAQIRIALTDRLQFVAYKDGYLEFDSGLIRDDDWNDLAAGIKWKFFEDWDNDLHAAVGAGYELGIGDDEVLQMDDEVRLWASVNKGFDKLHLGATFNITIPTGAEDTLGDSTRILWHLHADYFVTDWFSPVAEINGYATVDEGDNTPLPFNGVDVANLGGGQSEDVITLGLGGELRPADNIAVRGAYEFPLTRNEDLFGYRWTVSLVLSF